MAKDKRDIVAEYQKFCERERLVESMATASFFAECHLNKETKINAKRIATLYGYIESLSNK